MTRFFWIKIEPLAVRHMLPSRIVSTIFSCPWPRTCWTIYPPICYKSVCWIKVVKLTINFSLTDDCCMQRVSWIKIPNFTIRRCIPTLGCITTSIYIVPARIIFNPLACDKCSIFFVIVELAVFLSPSRRLRGWRSILCWSCWCLVCCWRCRCCRCRRRGRLRVFRCCRRSIFRCFSSFSCYSRSIYCRCISSLCKSRSSVESAK